MAENKVSLKLLVDRRAKRVLFAEAGKDFVDFLFHILSLPVGTVVELLTNKDMPGCLGDLCESIEALNNDYMQPSVTKDVVLKPQVAVNVPLLLLNNAPPIPTNTYAVKKFYRCQYASSSNRFGNQQCHLNVTDRAGTVCPSCNTLMSNQMNYIAPKGSTETPPPRSVTSEGYVKGVVTYMVMDNLKVKPMSTISVITLINEFNVKDISSLVEKQVQIGLNEGVALLKASLQTKAVLTTVFL